MGFPLVLQASVVQRSSLVSVTSGSGFLEWVVPEGKIVVSVSTYNTFSGLSNPRVSGRRDNNYELQLIGSVGSNNLSVSSIFFERDSLGSYYAVVLMIDSDLDAS